MKTRTPAEFLRTIYLGDRACKALRIESWAKRIEFEIDSISRIRSESGAWEAHPNDEIPNGRIVISGVVSIQLTPPGPLPNDFIEIVARPSDLSAEFWEFEAVIGSVGPDATTTEITVRIIGTDVHLEDPAHPDMKIRD